MMKQAILMVLAAVAAVGCTSPGKPDHSRAGYFNTLQQGCDEGKKIDCTRLFFEYQAGKDGFRFKNRKPTDAERVLMLRIGEKACDLRDGNACYSLGTLYAEEGNSTKEREYIVKAIPLLVDECKNQDNWPSCYRLGSSYRDGKGVEKDEEKAKIYFEKNYQYKVKSKEDLARMMEDNCKKKREPNCQRVVKFLWHEVERARQEAKESLFFEQ